MDRQPDATNRGRLLLLAADAPAANMAMDQALLESAGASNVPILRFYCWSQPTLSLGYFQRQCDRDRHLESQAIACVRRATGGGAIVHHHELTYSLLVPVANSQAGPRLDLYRQVHEAIVDTLQAFGVAATPFRRTGVDTPTDLEDSFLCFQRRTDEDLIVSGYKVLGSAQRKTRDAILQHGSLLLRTSSFAPQLPGICELTSRAISAEQVVEGLAPRFGRRLGILWTEDSVRREESKRATEIEAERFGDPGWMYRR